MRRRVEAVQRRYVGLAVTTFVGAEQATVTTGGLTVGGEPPGADSLFQIGSVSKVVTAFLLADAVTRGEVRLDTTVGELMPDLTARPATSMVTLEQLATHTSGLPRLPPGLLRQSLRHRRDPYRQFAEADLDRAVTVVRLRRPGGFRYSNFGGGLLGHLLARSAGTSYGQLVAERVTGPLRMTDTSLSPGGDVAGRRAAGHSRRRRPVPDWDLGALPGAGGLWSTTTDLVRFLRAHLDPPAPPLGAALREVVVPRVRAGGPIQLGLGWLVMPLPKTGETVVWHNGGTGGHRSLVGMLPDLGAGVAVLANSVRSVDALGMQVLRDLAALP